MGNKFDSNPISLDTFTAPIDVGSSAFGDTNTIFKINSIEWSTPTDTAHTALISGADSEVVFRENCTVDNQSIIKYFHGGFQKGLTISTTGVGSGTILINLY